MPKTLNNGNKDAMAKKNKTSKRKNASASYGNDDQSTNIDGASTAVKVSGGKKYGRKAKMESSQSQVWGNLHHVFTYHLFTFVMIFLTLNVLQYE